MKHYLIRGLAALLICLSFVAVSAPDKRLWPRWTAHDAASTQTIDYKEWQSFLAQFVFTNPEGVNLVTYANVLAEDKQKLKEIISTLAAIPISQYNRAEQQVYWINLYNALTVSTIIDYYPVRSIRDINLSSGLFSKGPWNAKLVKVEGTPVSLNDIEHRILRPIWNDPRIHYAVNCASFSCPNLMKIPYTSKNADQLLNQNAKDYVNSSRGVLINDRGQLIVSSLYIWYRPDFGGSDPDIIAHLREYAKPPLLEALEGRRSIGGHVYDWSLNDGRQ